MSFIIELYDGEGTSPYNPDGSEINGQILEDLLDCTRSGDMTHACLYVLGVHKPEFRIVKWIDGGFKNVIATPEDKQKVCESIYFDSDVDFSDESRANLYLVWDAAFHVDEDEN